MSIALRLESITQYKARVGITNKGNLYVFLSLFMRHLPLQDIKMTQRLIIVCGATGQLGGSVAYRMLKQGWRVRAITRNTTSAASTALKEAGAELATADYDDTGSLGRCFKVCVLHGDMYDVSC